MFLSLPTNVPAQTVAATVWIVSDSKTLKHRVHRVAGSATRGAEIWWISPSAPSSVFHEMSGPPRRTNEAKHTHCGSAQGSVISPLLANVYFRRFILTWEKFGYAKRLHARIVKYADDMVICCRPPGGELPMVLMSGFMMRLGLTVNEEETALVKLPEQSLDFRGLICAGNTIVMGKPISALNLRKER